MIELFPFQAADVQTLLDNDATGIVVADTGAGKTVIAAATAIATGVKTKLIVAPQGTHEKVWRRTILELDPNANVQRISGSEPGKQAMDDLEWKRPGYYLLTPQLFTRWRPWETIRPDLAIIDEAHLLTNRAKAGGKGLMKLKASHRIPMSGTIFRNHFENFWTINRWVSPSKSGVNEIADISPQRWITRYCETEYDHFAPGNRRVVGERNPGELAGLIPAWIQHFKREECCAFHPEGFLHNLPAPIEMTHSLEMTAEQAKAIRQMEEEYVAWLVDEREKRSQLYVKLPVTRMMRLSQMSLGVPKIREVVRLVEDKKTNIKEKKLVKELYFDASSASPVLDDLWEIIEANNGEPVVASTQFQTFAEEAVRRANARGIRAFEWSGSNNQTARDAALEQFRNGDLDLIVGVTSAVGLGIDGLQDASGILVSLDVDTDLTNNIQLKGRLDRRGQIREQGVLHYQLLVEGSPNAGVLSRQIKRELALNKSLRKKLRSEVA